MKKMRLVPPATQEFVKKLTALAVACLEGVAVNYMALICWIQCKLSKKVIRCML